MIQLKCECCGELFVPQRLNAKYCSDKCRNKQYYTTNIKKNYKYYTKKGKQFSVQKSINGKTTSFGQYDTEDEAKKVVQYLKQHHWKKSSLDNLKL